MEFASVDMYEQSLKLAIDKVLMSDVKDGVKEVLHDTIESNVYWYVPSPQYLESRRMNSGGLLDVNNYQFTNLGNHTLEVVDIASPQDLYGKDLVGIKLDEAVESGYNQGGAGARPFYEEAEKTYASGNFLNDVINGLKRLGF